MTTKAVQESMTPGTALRQLIEGNERFVNNSMIERDLPAEVRATAAGQYPFAAVISCLDSRISAELVFDQGIGDIFSGRVAGNVVNVDLLGSLEFACKLAGTKLIVVMGHTACGAVKGAADDAKLGNLTELLSKLRPAVEAVAEPTDPDQRNSANSEFVNEVAEKNVELTIDRIRSESEVLREMEDAGDIRIVGAMYDVADGRVTFSAD